VTEPDPRAELAFLARALRTYAEQCSATGATGLPPAPPGARLAPEPSAPPPAPAPERAPSSAAPPLRGAPDIAPQAVGPEPAARAPDDRARRLEVLGEQVKGCTRCGLSAERTQTVFARGAGSSRICFVGEGPGADEDAQGLPFVGKAGQLLDRMIAAMGLERDEVYICNVVKCRPPKNRKPEPDEMAACRPYLEEQLEILDPAVIVALGATAVEGLLGVSGGITRLRGKWRLYKGRIAVMPTFHPAYLLRTPAAKRDVWNDLQEVLRHLGRPIPNK